jgi:hypothetical protein
MLNVIIFLVLVVWNEKNEREMKNGPCLDLEVVKIVETSLFL